jgi:large repetitive protein
MKKNYKSNSLLRSKPNRIALEQRIVFDAALPVLATDFVDTSNPTADAPITDVQAAEATITHDVVVTDAASTNVDETTQQDSTLTEHTLSDQPLTERTLIEGTLAPTNLSAKEIIFIDTVVSDIQQYITDHSNADVVLIDSTKDGLSQIAAVLAGRTGIEAIHIVSHGTSGEITLGNGVLNLNNLNTGTHAADLAVIQSALTADGDILIYGCDVAAGAKGQAFINALASATLADIAASTNTTGHVDGKGDWVLETQLGSIETSAIAASDWHKVLIDTDGDLIDNLTDLDDDNDGILDLTEDGAPATGPGTLSLRYLFDSSFAATTPALATVASATAITLPAGKTSTNVSLGFQSGVRVSSYTAISYLDAVAKNDYVEFSFTTGAGLVNNSIVGMDLASGGASTYNFTIVLNPGTANEQVIVSNSSVTANGNVGFYPGTLAGDIRLQAGTTYTARMYLYAASGSSPVLEDMRFFFASAANNDTDDDGVVNSQDLDSDNDGISDLYESKGGTGVALNDINNDGTITIADGATSMVDANNDGVMDIYQSLANTPEIITNGTFSGATGWSSTGVVTIGGGTAVFGGSRTDNSAFQDVATVVGQTYEVNYTFSSGGFSASTVGIKGAAVGGSVELGSSSGTMSANVPVQLPFRFTATTTSTRIIFTETIFNSTSWDPRVSNVSVRALGTTPINTDGDTVADYVDLDSDNDGIADYIEGQPTAGYKANDGDVRDNDVDRDGVIDDFDSNDGTTKLFGGTFVTPVNTDGALVLGKDSTPDYLDSDSDGDGKSDTAESGFSLTSVDGNGDGIRDSVAVSYRNPDGVVTNTLSGVLANEIGDTSQVAFRETLDSDNDGVLNASDIDDDNDGILDGIENPVLDGTIDATWALNNFNLNGVVNDAAMITNVTAFTKGPAIGNASPELTSSGWFFPGISPFGGVPSTLTGTNGSIAENVYVQTTFTTTAAAAGKVIERFSNDSGLTSYSWAVGISTDNFATSTIIADATSAGAGTFLASTNTYVLAANTSYTLRVYFYNKTAPASVGGNMRLSNFKMGLGNLRDTDLDGIINSLDLDSDNDGISDLEESTGGTGVALKDLNNDGTITLAGDGAASMVDANANGLMDIFGAAGTGTSPINTDGDSRKDFLDLDSDNDGIADAVEALATSGYISTTGTLSTNNDLDNDGIVGRYDSSNAVGGAFGGNFSNPLDTDGDGKLDYVDTDSDNDGVLDADESGLSTDATDANGDGIRDSVGASYTNPDGIFDSTSPNRPIDLLLNEAGDTSQVAYREVNVAPVAVDDLTLTTREEVALVLNLLANDTDANLDVLSLRSINGELLTGAAQTITLTNAVISVTAAGVATFTPNANYVGSVSFTYEVEDPKGLFETGNVTINVTPVNDPPTAASKVITIYEDTPYTVNVADLGFADATDSPSPNSLLNLQVAAIPNAADGVFTLNGAAIAINAAISAADIAAGKLVFTPAANKNGNGLGTLSFKVQDNGGTANGGDNTSAASYTLSFNITPVDDVPTISLNAASDTGVSSTDRITQDTTPTFNGTGAPGDTINLYGTDGVTVLGTAVVAGDGTWSITSSTLTDGVQNLSVKATDSSGNEGTAATITVTIDTAPVSPLTVAISSDTDNNGFITPSDGYSQAATVVAVRVSLPTTGNLAAVGDTVTITDNLGNLRSVVLSAAQITAGFVDFTLPKPVEDTNISVSATITDRAGITNTAATDSAILNMLPPGTPTAEIVLDTNNDGYINASEKAAATTTDVKVTLPTVNPAQIGYTLRLYAADGTTLLDTRTLDAADIVSGFYTFTGITLPAEGASMTVKARLTDFANIDDAGWQAGTPGNDIATVDTSLPTIAISSGASTLNIASNSTTVTFTLSEASTDFSLADITVTGGGGLSNFAGSGTTYTATYTAPANTDATVSIAVASTKFTDIALNANADGTDPNNTLSLTVDTVLPVQPAAPTLTNDSGVSATDNIINVALPSFTISPPLAGETPQLIIDGVVVASSFDPLTNTLTPTSALSDGPHTVAIRIIDAGGNPSPTSTALSIKVDTVAPVGVSITSLEGNTINIAKASDGLSVEVTLPVGAAVGDKVSVSIDGSTSIDRILTAADVSSGKITVVIPQADLTAAGAGPADVNVTYSDVAGNTASPAPLNLLLDLIQPTVTVAAVGDGNLTKTEATDPSGVATVTSENTSTSTVTFVGPNGTVTKTINNNGSALPVTLTEAELAILGDGTVTIKIATTDTAGNVTNSPDRTFVLDTVVPTAPVNTTPPATNDTTPEIKGAGGNPGDTITLFAPDGTTVLGTTTVAPDGTWSITPTLAPGSYNLTVKATDAAGNQSPATAVPLTVDTTPPTITSATLVGDANKTAAEATSASGVWAVNGEAGTTSVVTLTGPNGTVTKTIVNDGTSKPVVLTAADLATLGDGTVNIATVTSDAAGNTTTSTAGSFALDTVPPTATVIPVGDANKTAAEATSASGVLTVNGEAGTTSVVTFTGPNGTVTKTVTNTGSPQPVVLSPADLIALGDGNITVNTVTTDTAGNTTTRTDGGFALDTTAPAAITVTIVSDTNNDTFITESADGFSQAATEVAVQVNLPSTGSLAVAGDTVVISDNFGNTRTVVISAAQASARAVIVNLPKPAEDTLFTVTATLTDFAGNATAPATDSATLDMLAPGTPAVEIVMDTNNDGLISASEKGIATTTDVKIILPTASPAQVGYTLRLLADDGTTVLNTRVLDAADIALGTYTFTGITLPAEGATLSVKASLTDGGGLVDADTLAGTPSNDSAKLDTALPTIAITSVNSALNNTTTSTTVTFTLSKPSTNFAIDDVSVTGGGTLTNFTGSGTTYTATYTAPSNTDATITIAVASNAFTDAALNANADGTDANNTLSITVDNVIPTAPSGISTSFAPGDLTNDSTPTFTGTGNPGDTITLYAPDGTTVLGTAVVASDGTWSLTPTTPISEGSQTLTVKSTDPAGNQSPATSIPITVDTTPPVAPTNVVAPSLTNSTSPTITGTGNPGDTINLYGPDGSTVIGTTTVAPDGTWSLIPNTPLPAGSQTLSVKATDPAGNEGPASSVTLAVDITPPVAPTSTTPANTNDTTPEIKGSGFPGDTITLFGPDGTTVLGTAIVAGDGTWSITPSTPLPLGNNNLSVKATDPAGNQSPATTIPVNVDQTPPVAPTIDPTSSQPTQDVTPEVKGTGTPGDTITLYGTDGTTVLGTTTVAPDGTWSISPSTDLPEGPSSLSVKATDPAGNEGPATTVTVTVDNTSPTVTSTPVGDSNKSTADATNPAGVLTINSEIGSTSVVTFSGPNGTVTKTISNDGTDKPVVLTAADLAILGDGTITATTVTTDVAGNTTSTDSGSFSLDTVPPSSTVTPLGDSSKTSAEATSPAGVLTVNGEAGATTAVTFTGPLGSVTINLSNTGTAQAVTLTPAQLALLGDGNITVSSVTTDPAGNTTTKTDGGFVLDTSPPSAPTVSISSDADDSGAITAADAYAQTATVVDVRVDLPTTGSLAAAGDSVLVTDNYGNTRTVVLSTADISAGFVTVTLPKPAEDTSITVTASITDAAGNGNPASATDSALLDMLPPGTPTVEIVLDANNDGYVNASEKGALTATSIKVNLPPPPQPGDLYNEAVVGNTVTIYMADGVTVLGTHILDASDIANQFYVFNGIALPAEGSNLEVKAQLSDGTVNDPGWTAGTPGNDIATLDSTLPTIAITSGTTTLNATTTSTTVTFTLSEDSTDFTLLDITVTGVGILDNFAGSGKVYTATYTAPSNTESTVTIAVANSKFTDIALNANVDGADADNTLTLVVDNILPVVTSTPVGDSNKSIADATSPAGVLTINSGVGSTSVVTFIGPNGSVSKTIVNDGTNKPVVLTAADLSILGDGTVTATTVTTDTAGNSTSTDSGNFSLDTAPPTVTSTPVGDAIKTTAEATSATGVLTINSEIGSTSVVTFTGPNGTVTKTITNDGTNKPVVLTSADLATLGDGTVTASTVTTDAAGNTTSTDSGSFSLDTTPPLAPGNTTPAATNTTTPAITGTGSPGDTITLFGPDGTTVLGTTTVAPDGTWSVTPTTALPLGNSALSVKATDPAGNQGPATSIPVNVDQTPPVAPTSTTPSITNDTTPAITGIGNPGDTITLFGPDGTTVLGTTTVAPDGTWSVTPTSPLPEGSNSLSVKATDPAGNVGPATPVTVTIDTVPPTAPSTQPTLVGANPTGSTSDTTPSFAVPPPAAGETPNLYINGVKVPATYDPVTQTLTPINPLPPGSYVVTTSVTDAAGNESPQSAPLSFKVEEDSPGLPEQLVSPPIKFADTSQSTNGFNNMFGSGLASNTSGIAYVLQSVHTSQNLVAQSNGLGMMNADGPSMAEVNNYNGDLIVTATQDLYIENPRATNFVENAVHSAPITPLPNALVQTSVRQSQTESLARNAGIASFNSASNGVIDLLDPFNVGSPNSTLAVTAVAQNDTSPIKLAKRDVNALVTLNSLNQALDKPAVDKAWHKTLEKSALKLAVDQHLIASEKVAPAKIAAAGFAKQVQASAFSKKAKSWLG